MFKRNRAKQLHCYMNPFQKWLNCWRLRRIIVALQEQVNTGNNDLVKDFAKSLEASEIMSRGSKKDAQVIITVERAELDSFIRYMCSLHDAKLSRIMTARIGLATLMTRNDKTLGSPAKQVIKDEMTRSSKPRSEIISHVSNQLRLKL